MIVVDYGGNTQTEPFGEIMALACQLRGVAGLVTNGAVRNSAQIAAMAFPTFAQCLNINGTTKDHRGRLSRHLTLAA